MNVSLQCRMTAVRDSVVRKYGPPYRRVWSACFVTVLPPSTTVLYCMGASSVSLGESKTEVRLGKSTLILADLYNRKPALIIPLGRAAASSLRTLRTYATGTIGWGASTM
jgi:hypothetical protein